MGQQPSGGRTPRATDDEILAVLRVADDPVLSTVEVADYLPIKRRSTLDRLRSLEERELVESKTIGGRNTVWWLSTPSGDDGSAHAADDPFFAKGTLFSSDAPLDESEIDDVVYGDAGG